MSEYMPLCSVSEIAHLDDEECTAGYYAGLEGAAEPGSAFSKSYWHGWRNGMMDSNRMAQDAAARALVAEVVSLQRPH